MIRKTSVLLLLLLITGVSFAQAPAPSKQSKLEWASQVPVKLPPDAKTKTGRVVLFLSLSETGQVTDAVFDSGDQDLAPYAIAAVKQWKAKPYLIDGKPAAIHVKLPLNIGKSGSTGTK